MEKQSKPIEKDIGNANLKTFKKLEFLNKLGLEAKERLDTIKKLDKEIDYRKQKDL